VVVDGRLLSSCYLGKKELRRLDEEFLGDARRPFRRRAR